MAQANSDLSRAAERRFNAYLDAIAGVLGHITGCFLALRLEVDLQRRLDAKGLTAPWPDLLRDLARLQAVIVDLDATRYRLRTDCQGHAAKAFQAAGVAIPPRGHRARPHPRARAIRRPRRRSRVVTRNLPTA